MQQFKQPFSTAIRILIFLFASSLALSSCNKEVGNTYSGPYYLKLEVDGKNVEVFTESADATAYLLRGRINPGIQLDGRPVTCDPSAATCHSFGLTLNQNSRGAFDNFSLLYIIQYKDSSTTYSHLGTLMDTSKNKVIITELVRYKNVNSPGLIKGTFVAELIKYPETDTPATVKMKGEFAVPDKE